MTLTFSSILRNQIVQSNKKLFRERKRERGYLHGEEERVAREEIRVLEVRREGESDEELWLCMITEEKRENDNDNDNNNDD